MVRALLREGVEADPADFEGNTPLIHAAMHGYGALADLLMLHGARPTVQRADKHNAIGLAALYGRPASLGA